MLKRIVRIQLFVMTAFAVFCVGAMPSQAFDNIGVYWDTNYSQMHTVAAAFEVVNGYIVITEPTGVGGILGWECEFGVTGPGVVSSWQLSGQAVNVLAPPSFSVGLAAPLPSTAAIMLASFNLLVTEYPVPIEIVLEPLYFASIPGQMAYVDAAAPEELKVMTTASVHDVAATVNGNTGTWCGTDWQHVVYFGPVTIGESLTRTFTVESCGGARYIDIGLSCEDPALALTGISGPVVIPDSSYVVIEVTFTPTEAVALECNLTIGEQYHFPIFGYGEEPVSVLAPMPLAMVRNGAVELEWSPPAREGDGYHVYRRDPAGQQSRLTNELLTATGASVRFQDHPEYPAGTVLKYSYAVVRDEQEISRSPEVEITVKSLPQMQTRLLANVPNPFNPQTRIHFEMARSEHLRISVFDLSGRRIKTLRDSHEDAGAGSVIWQGRDDSGRPVSSGAYYVRLETAGKVDHRKILMLK